MVPGKGDSSLMPRVGRKEGKSVGEVQALNLSFLKMALFPVYLVRLSAARGMERKLPCCSGDGIFKAGKIGSG